MLDTHKDFESASLGLRLFRVERDAHRDLITHVRQVLGDAEVRTLDDGRRVETCCLGLNNARNFEGANPVNLGSEHHRLRYTVHGEVTGNAETEPPMFDKQVAT